ncbi:MAG TPA: hypothetical protein DCZ94_09905 [Lentisphaeria bacterium]|nr:MAG: hypothetical protein A2X48_19140 [Lentisphaerae bacterium GWF2_49_21]HBC87257.1 hypothetical protein [Lentisphaeria bacterium]
MNASFLPEKVKSEFSGILDKAPVPAVRTSGNIDGEPGEGYVISHGDRLFIYSRKAGEESFLKLSGKFGAEISRLEIRKDKFNPFLDVVLDGREYSLKLSSSEQHDLEVLVGKVKTAVPNESGVSSSSGANVPAGTGMSPNAQVPHQGDTAPLPLTPMQFMAAAMMYVASSDGTIEKDEDRYILHVFCGNNDILQPALKYFKTHSADQLFEHAGSLNDEQKLCILANMIEIAMHDESYHRVEQIMIRNFMDKAGISKDNMKAISNVLLVKNNLSVLG